MFIIVEVNFTQIIVTMIVIHFIKTIKKGEEEYPILLVIIGVYAIPI